MIRLSKLADYGIVIVTHLAREPARFQTAPEIAVATQMPQPIASKVLKMLTRADLLSHRGAHGGYGLARAPGTITVAEVIEALDGPIAITTCLEPTRDDCGIRGHVPGTGELAADERRHPRGAA